MSLGLYWGEDIPRSKLCPPSGLYCGEDIPRSKLCR